MAGIVNNTEIANLTSDLNLVFQTFQRPQPIVIWKEPVRVLTPENINGGTFGFGGNDVQQQETFIPVSGIFPATVRYANPKHIGQAITTQDTNMMIPVGEVKIKVGVDCYNFIQSGQTDKISFDNRDWFFVGNAQACPFMGTLYYIYQLKPKI